MPRLSVSINAVNKRIKAIILRKGSVKYILKRLIDSLGNIVYDMMWDLKENCPFNQTVQYNGLLTSFLESPSNGYNFYSVYAPGGQKIYIQERGTDIYTISYSNASRDDTHLKEFGGSVFFGKLIWGGGTTWTTFVSANFTSYGYDGSYIFGTDYNSFTGFAIRFYDGSALRSYHYPAAGTSYGYSPCYLGGYLYFREQSTGYVKAIQRGIAGSIIIDSSGWHGILGPYISNGKCFYIKRPSGVSNTCEIYEIMGTTSVKIAETDLDIVYYGGTLPFTMPVINHSSGIYFPVLNGIKRVVGGIEESVPINQILYQSSLFMPFLSLSGDDIFIAGGQYAQIYALLLDGSAFEQIGNAGQFASGNSSLQCAFSTDTGLLFGSQDGAIQVWEKPYPWEDL